MVKQSAAKALEDDLDGKGDLQADPPADPLPDPEPERASEAPAPVLTQTTKPTRKPQAKPFVFNEQNWHLTVNDKHGAFECDLMGMNPHVQMRLAATGLAFLLRGRANKQKLLEGIMGGQFGGKRRQNYPATVIAYAAVHGVTIESAYAEWQQLDNAGKMIVRQSPRIRIALAQLAAERESQQGADA